MAFNLPHSGELRFSFRFDRASASGSGGSTNIGGVIGGVSQTTTWSALIAQRSAKLEALTGGHEIIAQRLTGKAVFDLWLRYDSLTETLQAGDRAVDLASNIIYAPGEPVDPNFRRQWLLIQATSNGRTS